MKCISNKHNGFYVMQSELIPTFSVTSNLRVAHARELSLGVSQKGSRFPILSCRIDRLSSFFCRNPLGMTLIRSGIYSRNAFIMGVKLLKMRPITTSFSLTTVTENGLISWIRVSAVFPRASGTRNLAKAKTR